MDQLILDDWTVNMTKTTVFLLLACVATALSSPMLYKLNPGEKYEVGKCFDDKFNLFMTKAISS